MYNELARKFEEKALLRIESLNTVHFQNFGLMKSRNFQVFLPSLIFNSYLHILVGWRYDFIFSFPLQTWQLFHCAINYAKSFLNLLFRNDKRRCKANYVLMGWFCLEELACLDLCQFIAILTSKPFSFINMQRSQALWSPVFVSSITIAFKRPFPRTVVIIGLFRSLRP